MFAAERDNYFYFKNTFQKGYFDRPISRYVCFMDYQN